MHSYTVITLTQLATTGTAEEIIPLSEQGASGVTTISVPPETSLVITDFDVAAGGNLGSFKLQQTNDGVNFFTIGRLEANGLGVGGWVTASPVTAWTIRGNDGPAVGIRLAVTTSAAAIPIACVMTGYRTT